MPRAQKYIWIDVEGPLRETDQAVLYDTDEGEVWLPKSQIGAHKDEDGKHTRLEITEWIAEQKGLTE